MLKRKSGLGGQYFELLEGSDEMTEEGKNVCTGSAQRWDPGRLYRYSPLKMHAEIKNREAQAALLDANNKSDDSPSTFRVVDWKAHFAHERRKNLLKRGEMPGSPLGHCQKITEVLDLMFASLFRKK